MAQSFEIKRTELNSIEFDFPPTKIPKDVFSSGRNVRYNDRGMEKTLGYAPVFGTTLFAPIYALGVQQTSSYEWLYAGLSAIGVVTSAGVHSDITHVSGVSGTVDDNWIGGVLNGKAFIGNILNDPMYWDGNTANKMLTLPGWPAGTKARCFRPFLNFIIALDVEDGAGSFFNMVKWSASADAGDVPQSWDETDATLNAGETVLADTEGAVIDCLPLFGNNIIYKDNSTYIMQFVGGTFIFNFKQIFYGSGILAQNCVVEVDNRHVVLTKNDIVIHDGRTISSIVNDRVRNGFFKLLNTVNADNSYVIPYYKQNEVWFCIPTGASVKPDLALIWNYRDDKFGFRDLPEPPHISPGFINLTDDTLTWDSDTTPWDDDTTIWNEQYANDRSNELVMLDGTKLQHMDIGQTDDGANIETYIEKLSMAIDPAGRDVILVIAMWPFFEGTPGDIVHIRIGGQMVQDDPIGWETEQSFVIGVDEKCDCLIKGRYISFSIRSDTGNTWAFHDVGFELSVNERY